MKVQGLHLWKVTLNGHGIGNDPLPKLLITTKKETRVTCADVAVRKALSFMRRYVKYKHATIEKIEYSGSLDA